MQFIRLCQSFKIVVNIPSSNDLCQVERITLKATEFAQCLINGALFSFDDFDFDSNELIDDHGQISMLIEHRCFGNFCILGMALPVSN